MDYRKCPVCKIDKELNSDNFSKTIHKGLPNFHRYCKPCRKLTRIDSYTYMTDEQKKIAIIKNYKFQKETISGRAIVMIKSYRTNDKKKNREFNLTKEWIIQNIIDKPCFYCEDTFRTGCERLDNNLGHTIENCVPCCAVCNSVRSNIFTILEMKEIGLKIKELRSKRIIRKVNGNKK